MMLNKELKMNVKASDSPRSIKASHDPSSQYRYNKQKRIPVFPQRLYDMLEHAEERGYDNVFSWMPDGKSFKVHLSVTRCEASEEKIIKVLKSNNFQQTKFRSFLRQLNQYGFERTHRGKGEFKHEFFVRGKRHLLEGKSIDDFQQPQECTKYDVDEEDDKCKANKSINRLLQLSTQDNTSLFLESDQLNYWKPTSANLLPIQRPHQDTPWQSYTKDFVIPTRISSLSHDISDDEQEYCNTPLECKIDFDGALFHPIEETKKDDSPNGWNDDDTIPTIASSDDHFDEWMGSEYGMMSRNHNICSNNPCNRGLYPRAVTIWSHTTWQWGWEREKTFVRN